MAVTIRARAALPVLLLAAALAAALAPSPQPASAQATPARPVVERLAGAERVATAALLARRAFSGPVPVAYVATAGAFPDALAAGPAAARENGPLLLVRRDGVPQATADALRALRPARIVVLGGLQAIDERTATALREVAPVERRSGPDRFATAAAISRASFPDGAPIALVASGATFPDALAGGAAAAELGGPLLLTHRGELPDSTAEELARLAPQRVLVLGGTGAVADGVAQALRRATGAEVQRLSGTTRYETAAAVARHAFPGRAPVALLASGVAFPDALAAAPVAAQLGGPVLLTGNRLLPGAAAEALRSLQPTRAIVVGGRAAVHENAEWMTREALGVNPDGHREDDPLEPQDLHLYATDAVLDELYARGPREDGRLPAVLARAPGGAPIPLAGIELRGFTARLLPKKSFDIRAEQGQPFLFGSTRMNANAGYTDPSLMRERLAFGAFTEIGHPAPRTRHVDLHVNDVYEGLYTHIERIDGALLRHLGLNPAGTLLRDEIREFVQSGDRSVPQRQSTFGLDLDRVADPQALLRKVFTDRSGSEADWARLEELVRWVHRTPAGDGFASGFAARFDVENAITWLAVHAIIGDVDAFGDDYWLYVDHTTPGSRWQIIPWDKDLTFGSHWRAAAPRPGTANDYFAYEYELQPGFGNMLVAKIHQTRSLRERLHSRIIELLNGPLSPGHFTQRIDAIAPVIADNVNTLPGPAAFRRNPGQHHGTLGVHRLHAENLRDFVELRSAFLRRRLVPIAGEQYRATADLTGVPPGRRVLLTDATGFTIGALTVRANDGATRITLSVHPETTNDGIRRRYRLESATGTFTADLSLYYRNEVESVSGAPSENWYATTAPVGGQPRLAVHVGGRFLPSAVNPFSNKVTAPVTVGRGVTDLRLLHRP
jgi:spore coat protein H